MGDVYAVIKVATALRKKDGTIYMTGIEDHNATVTFAAVQDGDFVHKDEARERGAVFPEDLK